MRIWSGVTPINAVMKSIRRLTKNGESAVVEREILSDLERRGYKLSPADLAKILLTLEILGYVSVRYSTKDENLVYLIRRG